MTDKKEYEDYHDIPVPDIDDDNEFRNPKRDLSGKFGYVAVAISIIAVISQVSARFIGVPTDVWVYFPFLWIPAGAIGLWGMFSDDRKSLDFFAIVASVIFGMPTIILSIQLLQHLPK